MGCAASTNKQIKKKIKYPKQKSPKKIRLNNITVFKSSNYTAKNSIQQ